MITRRDLLRGVAADGRAARMATPARLRRSRRRRRRGSGSTFPAICLAPQYVAEELCGPRASPTSQYVKIEQPRDLEGSGIGRGRPHDAFVAPLIIQLDTDDAIVLLGGVHVGCFELFGTDRVARSAT